MIIFLVRAGVFLFLFLSLLVTHDRFYHPLKGVFMFLVIFQLSLYCPLFFPLTSVLIIGMLQDLISFASLGFYTFFFVLIRFFLDGQKDYLFFKDFYYVWGIFTLFLLINMLIYGVSGWNNLLQETLVGCFFYPISAKIIQRIFRKF